MARYITSGLVTKRGMGWLEHLMEWFLTTHRIEEKKERKRTCNINFDKYLTLRCIHFHVIKTSTKKKVSTLVTFVASPLNSSWSSTNGPPSAIYFSVPYQFFCSITKMSFIFSFSSRPLLTILLSVGSPSFVHIIRFPSPVATFPSFRSDTRWAWIITTETYSSFKRHHYN